MTEPFYPHPLLPSGHLQTLAATFWTGKLREEKATQHLVQLPDDDAIVLHDDCPADWQSTHPMVVLLHGLGGSHRSPLLVRLAEKLNQHGIRTFRMDLRGAGAGMSYARNSYHAGRSEDLHFVLNFLTKLCPRASIGLAGFSLGGNIVLKYLGEKCFPKPTSLQAAVAVNPPLDLDRCVRTIQSGLNRWYEKYFLRLLLRDLELRRRTRSDLRDIKWTSAPRTLYEFDDVFTAPLGEFASAAEYYQTCSSGPLLNCIEVPSLIVSARDDPMVPAACFTEVSPSDVVTLEILPHGGHCGFIAETKRVHWLDERLSHYFLDALFAKEPRCLASWSPAGVQSGPDC